MVVAIQEFTVHNGVNFNTFEFVKFVETPNPAKYHIPWYLSDNGEPWKFVISPLDVDLRQISPLLSHVFIIFPRFASSRHFFESFLKNFVVKTPSDKTRDN